MKNNPKTPLILNILGLAVAIAAFMVVAMVRYYDLRYDKSYPGADRIYSVWLMSSRQFGNETMEMSIPAKDADYQMLTGVSLQKPNQSQPSAMPFEEMEDACILSGSWKRVARGVFFLDGFAVWGVAQRLAEHTLRHAPIDAG